MDSYIVTASPNSQLIDNLLIAGVGLVAAILGSIVGALMTGSITRKLQREALERAERGHTEAAAFYVRHLLMRIYSAALSELRHFEVARNRVLEARTEGPKSPSGIHISLACQPFANFSRELWFSREELYAMQRIGGGELLTAVASLDHQYNALVDGTKVYSARRMGLMDQWPGQSIEGGRVATDFTREEYEAQKHRVVELDDLIAQLEENASELYSESVAALTLLARKQGEYFGSKFELVLERLVGDPLTIRSTDSA